MDWSMIGNSMPLALLSLNFDFYWVFHLENILDMDGPETLSKLKDLSFLRAFFSWNGHLNRSWNGQLNKVGSPEYSLTSKKGVSLKLELFRMGNSATVSLEFKCWFPLGTLCREHLRLGRSWDFVNYKVAKG